jgi:hypothetical protein
MPFPNANYTDILATTIEKRNRKLTDNVLKNNAILARLQEKGRIKTFSGGYKIIEELNFQENGNFQWYSGNDQLQVSPQDMISAAEYPIKQAACAVQINGLEQLQNDGEERMIDLFAGRIETTESTFANQMSNALYSDGTGFGGKQLTGLQAAVPFVATNIYGGIDRNSTIGTFWRTIVQSGAGAASTTIQGIFNALWAQLVRGREFPDLILLDSLYWGFYMASLQNMQRFTESKLGQLGFSTLKFMQADVVLDGGIGGFCPASTAYFLNTNYIFYRPHSKRNMVPLDPQRRAPFNQDLIAQIIAFAGNMTMSYAKCHGVVH